MDVSFFKELYFREFEIKAQQDSRAGVFVALLSAIGGVLAFLIRNAWPSVLLTSNTYCLISLVLCLIALGVYFLSIVWVLMAMVGYTYESLPSPNNILVYWHQISRYYRENPTAPGSAGEDFRDYLMHNMASAASRNTHNNLARSARYYRASLSLVWVVVISALAALLLSLNQLIPVLTGICARKGV
jgi:hypothetical protein